MDDRLSALVQPAAGDGEALPPSQEEIALKILNEVRAAKDGPQPVLQLLGADSDSKLAMAQRVSDELGFHLFRVTAAALPQNPGDAETFAVLWQREAVLLPVALYIDASELDKANEQASAALMRLLRGTSGLIFLDTRDP